MLFHCAACMRFRMARYDQCSYTGVSRQGFDPGFVCIRDVPIIMSISVAYFVHDLKNRARLIRVREKGCQSKRKGIKREMGSMMI